MVTQRDVVCLVAVLAGIAYAILAVAPEIGGARSGRVLAVVSSIFVVVATVGMAVP